MKDFVSMNNVEETQWTMRNILKIQNYSFNVQHNKNNLVLKSPNQSTQNHKSDSDIYKLKQQTHELKHMA